MTSETDYEGPGNGNLPDDAPEADVLEQRQGPTVTDDRSGEDDLPNEADPADVEEQRHVVSDDGGEDEYR
ncbi:hypothetical protein JOF29_001536 [Kribbella aluminosa]|uniref:MatE family transporter n=1 Tax=Kribbella aluminosa TaxID=416017 RepID=A0ABS4UFL7_9ACTN|nr:hypothetical protein [Kribbella aluminosa]MBP2350453.1 hypothetical protein [Kribbella aluminosa]